MLPVHDFILFFMTEKKSKFFSSVAIYSWRKVNRVPRYIRNKSTANISALRFPSVPSPHKSQVLFFLFFKRRINSKGRGYILQVSSFLFPPQKSYRMSRRESSSLYYRWIFPRSPRLQRMNNSLKGVIRR